MVINYSNYQTYILTTFYDKNQYPSKNEKDILSKETNLTISQISNWFSNIRRRNPETVFERKKIKEISKENKLILIKSFINSPSLYKTKLNNLISKTKLSSKQIKYWYANSRRTKINKLCKRSSYYKLLLKDINNKKKLLHTQITKIKNENEKKRKRDNIEKLLTNLIQDNSQ
jgi:hypothetical protein